ncbi:MAG: DEAD/DEAH box helicase [Candidatus Hydrothermarchaeota archaeon]
MDLLSERIKNLIDSRFERFTEPQTQAIPLILRGKNLLLVAPTGMGKTEAVLLPVFDMLLKSGEEEKGIKILYITPLRALNRDLLERMRWWCEKLGISISVRHGDTTSAERRKQREAPPDILITTPETLQAILPGKRMRENLKSLKWVVVDEIHELADNKRGSQLTVALERLEEIRPNFQRIGLSATIGNPEKIADFLGKNVEILEVNVSKELSLEVESPILKKGDRELASILHTPLAVGARIRRIKELMKECTSLLIFVNTRELAEILGSRFRLIDKDIPLSVHHSSLSKEVRIDTENAFKSGEIKGIICTSSMELGIDIGSVDLVIQYMSPRQVTRLIQRVGRSGHGIDRLSRGVIISTNADDILESMVISRRSLNANLEDPKIHQNPLDVLAHQIAGITLDKSDTSKEEIYRIIKRAYPFKTLSREKFDEVLSILSESGLLRTYGDKVYRTRSTWTYYYQNLSMIPDEKKYKINDVSQGPIGVLDESFVVNYAEIGTTFICKGHTWQILDVKDDTIVVQNIDEVRGAIPSWVGEEIPVPFEVAQEVGYVRKMIMKYLEYLKPKEIAKIFCKHYPVDEKSILRAINKINQHKKLGVPLASHDEIVVEICDNYIIVNACFGSLTNETLGRIIADLLTARFGASVSLQVDPYRIIFELPVNRPEAFLEIIDMLEPSHLSLILEKTLKRSPMFFWKLLHVCRRFGVIEKDATLSDFDVKKALALYDNTPLYEETFRELLQEKLDIKKAEYVLEKLKSGEIKLSVVRTSTLSPISRLGMDATRELMSPKRADRAILKIVENRLLNERVMLLCVYCGKWNTTLRIKSVPDDMACPNCRSKFLAIVRTWDKEMPGLIKKYKNGKILDEQEQEKVKKAWKTANLYMNYGKRALIALAARGVGPEIGSRVLSQNKDYEGFLKDLIEAERTFARTRRFWD